jgi:hypothetical protein
MAVLAKPLGQNRTQGGVRIHHQNPLGLTSSLGWGQTGWYWRGRRADGIGLGSGPRLTALARPTAYQPMRLLRP